MQPDLDPEARERARRRQQRQERVQRRRLALGVGVLALIVLVVALVVGLSGGSKTDEATTTSTSSGLPKESATYSAELSGSESVPVVKTSATGSFIMTYDPDSKELSWVLEITHVLTSPTTAAIYQGQAGTTGAVVYTLYVSDDGNEGGFSGILGDNPGIIDEAKLVGPLKGHKIADLIQLIKDGNAYVSVGNKSHPVDAIRGQID
jgi:hypothetical protein